MLSELSREDWNPNALAVYPQGVEKEWQGDPDSKGIDDVTFTLELLDSLENMYCIDSSRIYATGKSNGTGFAHLLACDKKASTRIAAFAPVSGAYYQDEPKDECDKFSVPIKCNSVRTPIPILEFHGSKDTTIPYHGGGRRTKCLPDIPHWVREWSKRNDFDTHNQTTESYDGHVLKYEYGSDKESGTVSHYRINGLGHDWPSIAPNSDNPNGTYLDATPIIMDFQSIYFELDNAFLFAFF